MTSADYRLCPNCGAEMHAQGFVYVCDYCGSYICDKKYEELDDDDSSKDERIITGRYDYIRKNEQYILTGSFVKLRTEGDKYRAISFPVFSPNDGKYHQIQNFRMFLSFETDGNDECLFLGVIAEKYIELPVLTMLLNGAVLVRPELLGWEENVALFKMRVKDFFGICVCDKIDVSSNLIDTYPAIFNELIPYCHRFYHFLFDKRKYKYSIFKHLITD